MVGKQKIKRGQKRKTQRKWQLECSNNTCDSCSAEKVWYGNGTHD